MEHQKPLIERAGTAYHNHYASCLSTYSKGSYIVGANMPELSVMLQFRLLEETLSRCDEACATRETPPLQFTHFSTKSHQ